MVQVCQIRFTAFNADCDELNFSWSLPNTLCASLNVAMIEILMAHHPTNGATCSHFDQRHHP
jgi:hypothetical protein